MPDTSFKDSNEWRTVTLISRSNKATGKLSKKWNSKIDDYRICVIDFVYDVDNIDIISNSSVNALSNTKEIQYSEIYMTAIENQLKTAKMNHQESWKKQEVNCEEKELANCASQSDGF